MTFFKNSLNTITDAKAIYLLLSNVSAPDFESRSYFASKAPESKNRYQLMQKGYPASQPICEELYVFGVYYFA